MTKTPKLVTDAFTLFEKQVAQLPPLTLRGGDAVDSYDLPPVYDPGTDQITDEYLNRYACGLNHLDSTSWKHYLPHLIDFALRTYRTLDSPAIYALVQSLRPPDREPPRLASLSPLQEKVVVSLLHKLAFDEGSLYQEDACQALEEYWIEGALYRPKGAGA